MFLGALGTLHHSARGPLHQQQHENPSTQVYIPERQPDAAPRPASRGPCTPVSAVCPPVNDSKSAPRVDVGVASKSRQVGEFAKMESAKREDQLCKCGFANALSFNFSLHSYTFNSRYSVFRYFAKIELIYVANYKR